MTLCLLRLCSSACQCFSHALDCYYDPEVERKGASLDTFGRYNGGGVCISCQHNTAGVNCDQCTEGFYRPYGVSPESPAGCIRYLVNQATTKSPAGPIIGPSACPVGYFNSPNCQPCICDYRGTVSAICDTYGRCLCRQGVEGQRCDRCRSKYHFFPSCEASILPCNATGTEASDPLTGFCRCRPNVEGPLCDKCKPLYWNLASDNPQGCSDCLCNLEGTLSGVGQCEQKSGQCYCKPRACGLTCDTCKDGYFLLQKKNYFGCQGCQCDIGGAIDFACDETSGQCQCRKNIVGRTCTKPAQGYYFPDLHQLKYEVEDGTTPNARPVRFGYNTQEFPDFSWRGYAVMSLSQSEVSVTVHVEPKNGRQLYRVLLRFINPRSTSVIATIHVTNIPGSTGLHQRKKIIFPRSLSPTFLTVPGDSFAEPFALNPGKWLIHIRAEGVLLDYLVLLPKDYYEAPLLQEKVTQPCTYLPTANKNTNCLLYKHLPLEGFSSTLGSEGTFYTRRRHRRRHADVRRPTPDHPDMAVLNERQSQLQLSLRVPRPGLYALIFEYASEMDTVQNINILNIFDTVNEESSGQIILRANIYRCAYSNLCRSVAVNSENQVAMLDFSHGAKIILQTTTASFLLYKVYPVPAEEFSIEYVEPKVLCVSTHGHFTEDSRYCVKNQFYKPSSAWTVYASRDGQLISSPAAAHQQTDNTDWREKRQSGSFPVFKPPIGGTLLKYPQTEISFFPDVPLPGRYVLVLHYSQPEHVSFPVEVRVVAGQEWQGLINASFCPAISGCRQAVIADGQIALELEIATWQRPTISVSVPSRKTLVLDYIMLVPDNSYTPEMLKEKPLEKSSHFTQQCSGEELYINPSSSSQFCRDSLRSLVAEYNDGALSCDCDKSGSTGTVCNPSGGQCPCREHVIGRQCTKCATGYFGFPYCRPCECGQRLCDELTGRCICPPQTVEPACDMCQNQTFSYHPLIGCESCRCSPNGIVTNAGPQCDLNTGQCSCKPRIGGRRCDRCALGHYRFPDCLPCDCDQGGVIANVCDPDTGRCLCKFVEMHGWHLESPENEEIPLVLNEESNTVVADVQELPPTIHSLYWVAPPAYLGDRVTSYGGFFTYQSKSFGIPSEEMTLINRRADVVLTGHNMTLIHVAPQAPLPDQLYQGRVQLVEENWRQVGINKPVSREDLMMVLASLTGLRIRALYFTQSKRLSLGEVGLEGAATSGTGSPGNTVEHCSCPLQYNRDSCEKCAPGYYRNSGLFFDSCILCECNGLADECEDRTGKCLDCKYNTAGDQCERCKDGYYGNAAQRTCRVCPCPFTTPENSFAAVCTDVFGDVECICRTGYTGDRCERCTSGYYGDPLTPGGSCQPCNCGSGKNCDPKTGACRSTLEPGDTNIDEKCKECDNCAETLLHDLEKMDDGLRKIKAQLDNASASASSQDRLKKLEKAMFDTKNLVNKYRSAINSQKNRLDQLEDDMMTVEDDISSLENKADKKAAEADKAVSDVEKTHTRAKDLDSEIEKMLKKIQDLLDQLKNEGNRGDTPNENFAKLLEDAERMVDEMRNRDFTPQKTAAEKELEEAKKLLDNIKTKVTKQSDQNEEKAEKIRGLLQGYEAKLKDLDESLKDAVELVKNSNTQNNLNGQTMMDLLKRKDDIKKEHKTVEDQMALAKDELKKTEDLLEKLTNSKTEYEQLAAQLNGAKTDLTKKLNKITNAAAKKDLVEAAENHAKNLLKQAKDLEDSVKNASGRPEVQNAKDAVNAYKNITDAINAAEAAANEAKDAADEALNNVKRQKLPERTQNMKDTSEELLKNALDAQKDLQNAANILPDLKKRLANADKKKTSLENDIQAVVDDLNNVNRENIQDLIDNAKAKAAAANDSTGLTMDRLNAIRKELDKINVSPVDTNLGNVLDDVDKTVKNLWNTIPSLSDKISEVTNLTTQFFPNNNITENIKKIKELIELARDAANRIGIPMNFVGDGHVELRPPQNLDDLKAYTTLSLLLQRPEGRGDGRRRRRQTKEEDLFVMYLGSRDSSKNYIGMALRKNILFGVYKLNGVEYVMQTGYITKSKSEPATFDKVELRRIYQDAQMVLTKDITSPKPGEPIQSSSLGEQSKNLLDMDPSDIVFYVGGYPDNFTPPASLNYPKYKGCIEFSSFNDKAISLYNFQNAVNISQTPCSRYNPLVGELYFEGTGFAKVLIGKAVPALRISMSILSRSENGLLVYIGSEDKYFTVSVEKGVIFIRSNVLDSPATKNIKFFPKEDRTDFEFIIISNGRLFVRVASQEAASTQAEYNINDFKEFYIGGAPQDLRERNNITIQPFKGCLTNLQLNKDSKPIDEQVGVSKGCLKESLSSRNAEFSLLSSLSADLPDFSLDSDATVSIGFKSTENQGLILHGTKLASSINIALENGHVVLSFNSKKFKSNKQYNDGKWHFLTATKRAERIEMLIDDEDKGVEQNHNFIPETGSSIILGKDKFIGCVSNLYTRRLENLYRAEDLSHFKASGDILLDVCRANSLVQPMSDQSAKKR